MANMYTTFEATYPERDNYFAFRNSCKNRVKTNNLNYNWFGIPEKKIIVKLNRYENVIKLITTLEEADILFRWHDVLWCEARNAVDITLRLTPKTKEDEILINIILQSNKELFYNNRFSKEIEK